MQTLTLLTVIAASTVILIVVLLFRQKGQDSRLDSLRSEIARLQGIVESSAGAQIASGVQDLRVEQGKMNTSFNSVKESISQLEVRVQSLQDRIEGEQKDIRSELSQTRELIAEIKASAQARQEQDQEAYQSLRRLEAIIAGTVSRGKAGENILSEVIKQLPPAWRDYDVKFEGKTVEFAVPIPGGRYIPVDSKWTGVSVLERLNEEKDEKERSKLLRQVESEVSKKVDELTKYLDQDKTLMLAIAAVPDAVYDLCCKIHPIAYRKGVIVIGYSMAVPYLLTLIHLVERFGRTIDAAQIESALSSLESALDGIEETLDGRLSRGLKMIENACDEQRRMLRDGRRAIYGLRPEALDSGTLRDQTQLLKPEDS